MKLNWQEQVEAVLHNLWINAELYQHKLQGQGITDVGTPGKQKAEALQKITQLTDAELHKAKLEGQIEELKNFFKNASHYATDFQYEREPFYTITDSELADRISELKATLAGLDQKSVKEDS